MHLKRSILPLAFVLCLPCTTLASAPAEREMHFPSPIDAVSVTMPDPAMQVEVSAFIGNQWKDWQQFELDADVHPTESNVIIFNKPVTTIRIRGDIAPSSIHPLTLSKAPAPLLYAGASSQPHILTRKEWGADESLRFNQKNSSSSSSSTDKTPENETTPSNRVRDCQQAQQNYPQEFKIDHTEYKDANGNTYLWPQQFSKQVKLLIVHHTAFLVGGDQRSAVERIRALYQYHAKTLGWGDVGYNYLIDENGQIYEGRAGGDYVVGGHAYCNNIGTAGIALLGNFEIEQPTPAQIHSLQWLIDHLSQKYGIDMNRGVEYHGKQFLAPVVGHRDVLSTSCPGYYAYGALGQIIAHVKSGNLLADVTFPSLPGTVAGPTASSAPSSPPEASLVLQGTLARGSTALAMNPGGKQRMTVTFIAGAKDVRAHSRIALVAFSSPDIGIALEDGTNLIPLSSSLSLPRDARAGERVPLSFIVQAPIDAGTYSLQIGDIRYSLIASGRRTRTEQYNHPFLENFSSATASLPVSPVARRRITSASVPGSTAGVPASVPAVSTTEASPPIRLRLALLPGIASLSFTQGGEVGGSQLLTGQRATLDVDATRCQVLIGKKFLSGDAVTFMPALNGLVTVETADGKQHHYKGTIECRVINGQIVLINELPLEDYLRGLSEEPDSEPLEKQRAFAIAARSYAAYYLDGAHRKFPGQPYDGTDSPVTFQKYSGADFESGNPEWLRAVATTAGQVLKVGSMVIRAPYFSSDDGRTRSPAEAGWTNFPFVSVFLSKPDPWCSGMPLNGHGVGMSGCGAKGQAKEGKAAEQILQYYYPNTSVSAL